MELAKDWLSLDDVDTTCQEAATAFLCRHPGPLREHHPPARRRFGLGCTQPRGKPDSAMQLHPRSRVLASATGKRRPAKTQTSAF